LHATIIDRSHVCEPTDPGLPRAKDLMLNHAYKAMAWLGEAIGGDDSDQARHCTDAIEEALCQHRKSLFGAISVAFFDTTSLYFEGDGGATLGQRGHTKGVSAPTWWSAPSGGRPADGLRLGPTCQHMAGPATPPM
jgi:hypothetical protein